MEKYRIGLLMVFLVVCSGVVWGEEAEDNTIYIGGKNPAQIIGRIYEEGVFKGYKIIHKGDSYTVTQDSANKLVATDSEGVTRQIKVEFFSWLYLLTDAKLIIYKELQVSEWGPFLSFSVETHVEVPQNVGDKLIFTESEPINVVGRTQDNQGNTNGYVIQYADKNYLVRNDAEFNNRLVAVDEQGMRHDLEYDPPAFMAGGPLLLLFNAFDGVKIKSMNEFEMKSVNEFEMVPGAIKGMENKEELQVYRGGYSNEGFEFPKKEVEMAAPELEPYEYVGDPDLVTVRSNLKEQTIIPSGEELPSSGYQPGDKVKSDTGITYTRQDDESWYPDNPQAATLYDEGVRQLVGEGLYEELVSGRETTEQPTMESSIEVSAGRLDTKTGDVLFDVTINYGDGTVKSLEGQTGQKVDEIMKKYHAGKYEIPNEPEEIIQLREWMGDQGIEKPIERLTDDEWNDYWDYVDAKAGDSTEVMDMPGEVIALQEWIEDNNIDKPIERLTDDEWNDYWDYVDQMGAPDSVQPTEVEYIERWEANEKAYTDVMIGKVDQTKLNEESDNYDIYYVDAVNYFRKADENAFIQADEEAFYDIQAGSIKNNKLDRNNKEDYDPYYEEAIDHYLGLDALYDTEKPSPPTDMETEQPETSKGYYDGNPDEMPTETDTGLTPKERERFEAIFKSLDAENPDSEIPKPGLPTAKDIDKLVGELNALYIQSAELNPDKTRKGIIKKTWRDESKPETYSFEIQSVDGRTIIAVGTPESGALETLFNTKDTNYYVVDGDTIKKVTIEDGKITKTEDVDLGEFEGELKTKISNHENNGKEYQKVRTEIGVKEKERDALREQINNEIRDIQERIQSTENELKSLLGASKIEIKSENEVTIDGEPVIKGTDGRWRKKNQEALSGPEQKKLEEYMKNKEDLEKELADEKRLKTEQEDISVKTITDPEKQRLAYELTWELMNLALEEFAFEYVDDMCKQDWEASEPPAPPQDTSTGGGGTGAPGGGYGGGTGAGGTGGTGACYGDSITAQLRIKPSSYEISYTVGACYYMVRFWINLKSASGNDFLLDDGFVGAGDSYSNAMEPAYLQPNFYNQICVKTDSLGEKCFPGVVG